MKIKKILIFFLFIGLNLFNLFLINYTYTHLLLFIFTIVIAGFFFINFNFEIKKSFILISILIYLFCSHSILPLLISFNLIQYDREALSDVYLLTLLYYNILFVTFLIFKNKWNYFVKEELVFYKKPKVYLVFFFLFIYSLSLISLYFGIGRMGGENIALPFKLAGIINYLRIDFVPFGFVILYSLYRERLNKTELLSLLLFFFLWCVFDAFVRLSRSAVVEYMIPFFIYVIITNKESFKSLFKIFIPIFIINVSLYPVITALRDVDDKVSISSISRVEATEGSDQNIKIWKRTFSNAFFYERYQPFVSFEIFDFSNFDAIYSLKGSHNFTTIVVDGLGNIAGTHSSGTTGLADSLLIGGVGFSLFTFGITVIIALYFDSPAMRSYPVTRAFGFFLVRWLIWYRSWSLLFDPTQIFVFIALYMLVRKK